MEIKFPTEPCIEFLKEKKFCELEDYERKVLRQKKSVR